MAAAIRLNEQHSCSFDHLVGGGLQSQRYCEAECFGGFEIDHELELGRLDHWQVCRFFSLENTAGVDADQTMRISDTASIAH